MEISIVKTNELIARQWDSYTHSFNFVFNKNYIPEHFVHKYQKTCDRTSYHALLIDNNAEIQGGCSVIPYHYIFGIEKIKIGLVVDVFIHPMYRSDPYSLHRMYQALKSRLNEEEISMIIAVSNELVYPYWKNIVKWKEIGTLSYFACPLRLANILASKNQALNMLSLSLTILNFGFNTLVSWLFNATQKQSAISVDRTDPTLEEQRYTADHIINKNDQQAFFYRIVEENQVQTAYLIDFYNQKKGVKDLRSLLTAVKFILKNHRVDIIIFIGKLNFFQTLLLKIPKKYEPKHLHLMCDFIKPIEQGRAKVILDLKNWDFGLFNFDVR